MGGCVRSLVTNGLPVGLASGCCDNFLLHLLASPVTLPTRILHYSASLPIWIAWFNRRRIERRLAERWAESLRAGIQAIETLDGLGFIFGAGTLQNPLSAVSNHPANHPERGKARKGPIGEDSRRLDEKSRRLLAKRRKNPRLLAESGNF